jgi:hypothetical protein
MRRAIERSLMADADLYSYRTKTSLGLLTLWDCLLKPCIESGSPNRGGRGSHFVQESTSAIDSRPSDDEFERERERKKESRAQISAFHKNGHTQNIAMSEQDNVYK